MDRIDFLGFVLLLRDISRSDRYSTRQKNEIEYIRTQTDTDVISISVGYANSGPLDGTSEIDAEIEKFTDEGGVFVTSAGNQANGKNWDGDYADADGDDFVDVTGTSESGEQIDVPAPSSGRYGVFLQWDDWDTGGSDEDYVLQVVNGDTGTVIRESDNIQDGSTSPPTEAVAIESTDTNPQVRLKHKSGATDAHLVLNILRIGILGTSTQSESLLIPATEESALAVGAYGDASIESEPNALKPFSSRGPTVDGEIKPQAVGPDGTVTSEPGFPLAGTSYSAPHVAGVMALAAAEDDTLSSAEYTQVATGTTTSLRPVEPNNQVGFGLIDAEGVVREVEQNPPTVSSYTVTDATDGDGIVAEGDQIAFATDASDEFTVSTVEVDASAYGAGAVTLTDDGTVTYTGTATVGSSASEGASGASVTATDQASNQATTSDSSVIVDNRVSSTTTAESVVSPTAGTVTVSGTTDTVDTLAFEIQDGTDGDTATVTKSISSTSYSVEIDLDSLSYSGGDGTLDDGTATLNVEQAESFSTAEASTTVTTDRTPPELSVSSPTSQVEPTSGSSVDVRFTPDDTNNNGIQSAAVEFVDADGNTVASASPSVTDDESTTATVDLPAETADEAYDGVITTTDAAGNTKTDTATDVVVVDDKITSASVASSVPQQDTDSLTVSGTSDAPGPVTVRLTDSDGDTATTTTSISQTEFSLSVTPGSLSYAGGDGTLGDGDLTVELEQADTFSKAESTVNTRIDTVKPSVSVESPSNQQTITTGTSQDVSFTVSDSASSLGQATVQLRDSDGTTVTETTVTPTDGESTTVQLTPDETVADGEYDIRVVGTDAAGNARTVEQTSQVVIDDTVSDVSAASSVVNASGSLTLSGTADSGKDLSVTVTGPSGTTSTFAPSASAGSFSTSIDTSNIADALIYKY